MKRKTLKSLTPISGKDQSRHCKYKPVLIRLFFIFFLVGSSHCCYSQDCSPCLDGIKNDPQSPSTKYVQLATQYPNQSQQYASAAMWIQATVFLKFCGYCLKDEEKEYLSNTITAAEGNLRNLRSKEGSGPVSFAGGGKEGPVVTLAKLKAELEAYHYNGSTNSFAQNQSTNGIENKNSDLDENVVDQKKSTSVLSDLKAQFEQQQEKDKKDIGSIAADANSIKINSGTKRNTNDDDGLFDDKNNDNAGIKGAPTFVELKQQAKDFKLEKYNDKITKSSLVTGKACSKERQTIGLSKVAWSEERSKHSIDASQPWSQWVSIPGTALQVRYSTKKVCDEPEFPYTTDIKENLKYIDKGIDQFFDYGFIQFKNTSNVIVSGKFSVILSAGKNKSNREDGPIYLEPNSQDEESIGNWYSGCSILALIMEEYCTKSKQK